MISRSRSMSLVPIVSVPLNIMCSNRCEIPVMPVVSLADPTRAKIEAMMVGASCRSTIKTCMPLSSQYSLASIFCAAAGSAAASVSAAAQAANRCRLLITHSSVSDRNRRIDRGASPSLRAARYYRSE